MKKLVAVLIVAAVMMMSVSAFAADINGADLYKTKCAGCHGADGTPSKPAAGMGAKALKDPAVAKKADKDFIEATTNGVNKMPAYKGKLSDDQIKAVATYMKTLTK